jgi:hypothetical protein
MAAFWPHDPQRPLVCLDETSKPLIIETRAPIPAKPGRKARHDYEYERNGVANLFMVFAPLAGLARWQSPSRRAARCAPCATCRESAQQCAPLPRPRRRLMRPSLTDTRPRRYPGGVWFFNSHIRVYPYSASIIGCDRVLRRPSAGYAPSLLTWPRQWRGLLPSEPWLRCSGFNVSSHGRLSAGA